MTDPGWEQRFRARIESFNAGDWDAILEDAAEDIELQRAPTSPDAGEVVSGRDAVLEFFKPDLFADQHVVIEKFHLAENCFWVQTRFTATGSASGLEISLVTYAIYRVSGDEITRIEIYDDESAAREAARD